MKHFFALLLIVVVVTVAQMTGQGLGNTGAPSSNNLGASALTDQLINDPGFRGSFSTGHKNTSAAAAAVTFRDGSRPPSMPARLAQGYPAAKRAEIEKLFTTLLTLYPKLEQFYGWQNNDLAGAMTVFVVSTYQAASGADVKDPQVKAVAQQMRSVLGANASVARASDAARQEMYEQMAILGMFTLSVQQALKTTPNAQLSATTKKAGEDYLRTFLGADSERIAIGESGMTVAGTQAASVPAPAEVSSPPAPGTKSNVSSSASHLADSIETVGFYTKTGMGYGGMLTFDPTPIVLFKSGEALREMEALKSPGGLAAHKASHPKDWTTWRRAGNAIEIVGSKGWEKITYTKTMDRLPSGFTLQGSYQRLSGGGNLAVGGTAAIAVWSDLSFDRAGNFASGGGSGASNSVESADVKTSVVTSSTAPNRHGRYTIDGYTLTLNYADGRVEHRMIVTERADPSVIWLDGDGYTKKK